MKRFRRKYLIGGWTEFNEKQKIFETVRGLSGSPIFAIYKLPSQKVSFRTGLSIRRCFYKVPYKWYKLFDLNLFRLDYLDIDLEPTFDECFEEICNFLQDHLYLEGVDKYVLGLYLLSTWFFDRFEFFPALHILVPSSEISQMQQIVGALPFRSLTNFRYYKPYTFQTFLYTLQPTMFYTDPRNWETKSGISFFLKRTINHYETDYMGEKKVLFGRPFIPQIILSDSSLPVELDWISIPVAPRVRNSKIDEEEVKAIRNKLLTLRFKNLFSKGMYHFKFDNSTRIDKLIEVLLTLYKPKFPPTLKLRKGIRDTVEERYLLKYSFWPRRIAAFLCVKLENYQSHGNNYASVLYLFSQFKKENPDFDLSCRYFYGILKHVLDMPVYRTDKAYKLDLTKVDLNSLKDKFDLNFKEPKRINSKSTVLKSLLNELGYTLYG